jgi:hypothetical protein
MGYGSPDSWVYLVAYLPLVAIAIGDGIQWLADRGWLLSGMRAALGLLVPLLLLSLNWRTTTLAGDLAAVTWIDVTLDALPVDAVVITDQDRHTFALWYATGAMGRRPDLTIIYQRLWGYSPYNAYLGDAVASETLDIETFTGGRPLCRIGDQGEVSCL